MATLTLPTPLRTEFGRNYRFVFDGVSFRLSFVWNDRNQSFALTLIDGGGNAIVRNLRMVVLDDILAPYKALAVPQGQLNVVDTSGVGLDPVERTDFGDRVQLQYVEVDAT